MTGSINRYTDIQETDIHSFRHIIAGAFFQMQSYCIERLKEINQLIAGDILYIDVYPAADRQLILCEEERINLLSQLGANHILSVAEIRWKDVQTQIKDAQNCKNGIYKGPFLVSGLTENGIDYSRLQQFLSRVFEKSNSFEWHKELGFFYPLKGTVVYGNKIGRTLGYPTINVKPTDNQKLIPPMGVYTGYAKHKYDWFRCMINIGIRPTLDLTKVTIEAHIFDFSEEIYGDDVTLHFTGWIREEMRFPSLESLKIQLNADKKSALNLLDNTGFSPAPNMEYMLHS